MEVAIAAKATAGRPGVAVESQSRIRAILKNLAVPAPVPEAFQEPGASHTPRSERDASATANLKDKTGAKTG